MHDKLKILSIDDDLRYLQSLAVVLQDFADIHHVLTEGEFFSALNSNLFDLVLVDLNLDGGEIGQRIAKAAAERTTSPILFLTSDNSFETKISCLRIGVSDFLWKTMPSEEIQIRIMNAVKNRKIEVRSKDEIAISATTTPVTAIFEIGNMKFNLAESVAVIDDKEIEISRTEARMLKALAATESKNMSKEGFVQSVWKNTNVSENAVYTAIYQLNKKLGNWSHRIISLKGQSISIQRKD